MAQKIVIALLVVALCAPLSFGRGRGGGNRGGGGGGGNRSGGGTIGAIGGVGVPGQGHVTPGWGNGGNQVDVTPDGGASFVGSLTPPDEITKFTSATKEQIAAALDTARKEQQAAADKLKIKFTELQTDHFIIFTDWETRHHDALKKEAEAAYSLVCKAFSAAVKESVFVGKLPIYVIAGPAAYQTFAKEIDSYDVPDWAIGYCWIGKKKGEDADAPAETKMHLVMGPFPTADKDDPAAPPVLWRGAMTRAETYAFIMRYRSNQPVPFWLMQGVADVIADGVLPNPILRQDAYLASVDSRFDPTDVITGKRLGPDTHPVMQTLVETLMTKDRKALLGLVNSLKDGKSGPAALDEAYHWSYDAMQTAWRQYLKRFAPPNRG